jgi:hypothetical protein
MMPSDSADAGRNDNRTMVGKGKVSESDHSDSIRYWQSQTQEVRVGAIFEIRRFYYEVLKPGTGAERLDRSVVGFRSLRN